MCNTSKPKLPATKTPPPPTDPKALAPDVELGDQTPTAKRKKMSMKNYQLALGSSSAATKTTGLGIS